MSAPEIDRAPVGDDLATPDGAGRSGTAHPTGPHGRRRGEHGRARVIVLSKYGRRAAGTRYRFLQFFPALRAAGIDCEISPLLDDDYLSAKLDRNTLDAVSVLRGVTRRLRLIFRVRRYDAVILHMEALPFLPPWFERALRALAVPYVYDLDDAVFHKYGAHPSPVVRRLLGQKIRTVVGGASAVIAGNEYLADHARQFNTRVTVVPTVVDTSLYVPRAAPVRRDRVVIGWIGSPTTAPYVARYADAWRELSQNESIRFRLVGAGSLQLPGVALETRPWREDQEIAEVRDFDIGIMPLDDDPWARGKCGFKLVQYMACGVPVVASPVGVNGQMVLDGSNGFLCRSSSDWVEALSRLSADGDLRRTMGARGRRLAEAEWSVVRWAPVVLSIVEDVVRANR